MWTAGVRSAAHHGRGSRQRHAMPRASLWGRDRMNVRHIHGILRWPAVCSCQALPDAVAGHVEAGRYGPLREATAGQPTDAAGLAHREVIDQGDDHQQRKGHLKDGRKQNRNHFGSLGREGAGPVQRIGRGGSCSPGSTGRGRRRMLITCTPWRMREHGRRIQGRHAARQHQRQRGEGSLRTNRKEA